MSVSPTRRVKTTIPEILCKLAPIQTHNNSLTIQTLARIHEKNHQTHTRIRRGCYDSRVRYIPSKGQNSGRCLSKTDIHARTKFKWQCPKGHKWESKPELKLSVQKIFPTTKEESEDCHITAIPVQVSGPGWFGFKRDHPPCL